VRYTLRDQDLLTFVSRHIDTALSRRTAAEAIHAANLKLEARVQSAPANSITPMPSCNTKTPTMR
jgi:hypothetical protein